MKKFLIEKNGKKKKFWVKNGQKFYVGKNEKKNGKSRKNSKKKF